MKPSGIDWIGDIPAEWETSKIKYVFQIVCGSTPESDNTEFWDGDISWITPADMNDFGMISEGERNITKKGYNSCGTLLLPKGSVVISTRAPIGKINITSSELCTNQGCKSLINQNMNTKYFYYLLNAGREELIMQGRGTTFIELGTFELGNIGLVFPPQKEQQAIAAFLDSRCRRIDGIIAEMEQQIDILKQYKTSLITETVTKGLNKAAPMKDSGIDWIGKIPVHWEVKKIKYLLAEREGGAWGQEPVGDNDDIVCVRVADFDYKNQSIFTNNFTIRNYDFKIIKKLLLKKGDILIEKSGGGENTPVGRTVIFQIDQRAVFSNFIERIRLKDEYYPSFIHYMFVAIYQNYINIQYIKQTTGIQNLDLTAMLANIVFPVTTYSEQQTIAAFLDEKCGKIADIITAKRQSIETMKAYKKSLIYEYVTGKKRVKGHQ
jgi:type I restriction enzyme S subunit